MNCNIPTCREQDPSSCHECPQIRPLSKVTEVKGLLKSITDKGLTICSVERSLDLKPGTLDLKNLESSSINKQRCTPEMIALLKIINLYPWMVKVADKDSDVIESKKIMCHSAVDEFFKDKK